MSTAPRLDALAAARTLLSQRPAALVTDVDGTISPIVSRPEEARVQPGIVPLLRRLAGPLDLVAAISGRSIAQLRPMIDVEGMVYVGNHGLEWWDRGQATIAPEARPYLPALEATMMWLRERLELPGVLVEDKGATGSVHYRLSPDPAAARQTILQTVAQCPSARDLQVAEGRMVVNLRPPVPADKGTAVERLVRRWGLRGVLYLGDDLTDLDAFQALRSLRQSGECDALLVGVASPEAPPGLIEGADHLLSSVDAVESFLRDLAEWLDM
ncbi:MAG: trehalose-phosphatase [Chloroflexota bacterium]